LRKHNESTVLLIDDQIFLLLALEAQISDFGVYCELQVGGVAAIDLLQQMIAINEPLFKVILVDFSMPDLDGPETSK